MAPDQIGALLTATGLVIGSIATLIAAIGGLVKAIRAGKDDTPAPQVGIPAGVADGDIDYRAYADMKAQLAKAEKRVEKAEADRDAWMRRALGIDEDTHPT